MVVTERTVGKESGSPNGDRQERVETESVDLPGVPRDGKLRPIQRATTHHVTKDGSQSTEAQVEQPTPGSLTSEMRVTSRTLEVVRPGPAGTSLGTTTVQWLDGAGNLSVVWVTVGSSTKSSDGQANLALPGPPAPVPAEAAPAEAPSQPKQ